MPRLQPCPLRQLAQRLVCCLCLLVLPALCAAQHQPFLPADLDNKVFKVDVKAASLETMVALLAKQLNVSIYVDDTPHHTPIDFTIETTVRKALDRIADAYDYEWKLTKSGAFTMVKRFKDPAEFPQTEPAEWRQTAKDALRLIGETAHDFSGASDSRLLSGFVSNVTFEQALALLGGQRLTGRMLEEGPLSFLREYMYLRAFASTVGVWEGLSEILQQMSENALQWRTELDGSDAAASVKEKREQKLLHTLLVVSTDKAGIKQSYPLATVSIVLVDDSEKNPKKAPDAPDTSAGEKP